MSDWRTFRWVSGRLYDTSLSNFWQAPKTLDAADPQIPNLPLLAPQGGSSTTVAMICGAGLTTATRKAASAAAALASGAAASSLGAKAGLGSVASIASGEIEVTTRKGASAAVTTVIGGGGGDVVQKGGFASGSFASAGTAQDTARKSIAYSVSLIGAGANAGVSAKGAFGALSLAGGGALVDATNKGGLGSVVLAGGGIADAIYVKGGATDVFLAGGGPWDSSGMRDEAPQHHGHGRRGGPLPDEDITSELVEQYYERNEALRKWFDERNRTEARARIEPEYEPSQTSSQSPAIGRANFDIDAAVARQRKGAEIVAPTRTEGYIDGARDELMTLLALVMLTDDDL